MIGFTDEEVSAAVDQFLLRQVTVPTQTTGVRDILASQRALYDLLTTALLLKPESYFYLIFLARNKLMALVSAQLIEVRKISESGPGMSRSAKSISSTTDLAAAQASLLDLNAGLNARSTGIRGSIGPAVDRFRKSVSSFVGTELSKNILVGGQITSTADELRRDARTLWASILERNAEIVELCNGISQALSRLEQVRLPESSVRDIVSRIQNRLSSIREELSDSSTGSTAIASSRIAALELLTMRTLLTKASSFRNPELVRMPKLRDSASLTQIDSPGTEASILGTVSGPFNYLPSTTIGLSVNGGGVVVGLPGTSCATIRSRQFSVWVPPTIGDEVALQVDQAGVVFFTLPSAYASGAAAAAGIGAGLGPSVTVSWDAVESRLVFASANPSDVSQVRLVTSSGPRQAFREWAFPVDSVASIESVSTPVPSSSVVSAFAAASPDIGGRVVSSTISTTEGFHTSNPGDEAVLWSILDEGSDLVSTGTVVVTGSKNFEALGVQPGMGLWASPSYSGQIRAVEGSELTLDTAPPAGTLAYYIGPDYRELPANCRIRISGSYDRYNNGHFRLVARGVGRLELDRDLSSSDANIRITAFTEFVEVFARGTTTSSGIGVPTADAGSAVLGIAAGPESPASLTGFALSSGDFLLRGVQPGDEITLTAPSSTIYPRAVSAADTSNIFVSEPVPYEIGDWGYVLKSARASAYLHIQAGSVTYTNAYADMSRLAGLVQRLLNGARYSGEILSGIAAYDQSLVDLYESLSGYSVPRERSIDSVIKTFSEQGLDRALDLLLSLQVVELFTMDADGVSYVTWMNRKAATVSREVVPVSKLAKSQQIAQEWRVTSFQPNPFDPNGTE